VTNRFRLVNALLLVAFAGLSLWHHSPWLAALATFAAARCARETPRLVLFAIAVALLVRTVLTQPFAQGQALLSDLVFPFSLIFVGAMLPAREAARWWPAATAIAGALFLIGGAAHDNALTGEVAAALCVTAGQWRR